MPKRTHPLIGYLLTLGGVIAAYGLYALVATPLLEGPARVGRAAVPGFDPQAGAGISQWLQQWFDEGQWELGENVKILETRQGTILFQDYQPHSDGRIDVHPLTVVLRPARDRNRPPREAEPPVILQAPEGATLKFDQPLSLGGSMGRLEGGRLSGPVRVRRKATDADGGDALDLHTRNVQLSEKRIFTMEEVRFRYGSNTGNGRNLNIDLIPNSPASQVSGVESSLGNVARMELGKLDELLVQRATTSRPATARSGADAPLRVTCEGIFAVDFVQRQAVFNRNVRVVQLNVTGDQVNCDRLVLYFSRNDLATSESADAQSETDRDRRRRFSVTRMIAKGSPAVLVAPSQQARAEGEWLEYDLDRQQVLLKGARPVSVRRADQSIRAAQIQYSVQQDGSLGITLAEGPGSVTQQASDQQRGFQCHWNNQLTIQPSENKKVISLSQDALVIMDDGSQMSADRLHLWLWELSAPAPGDRRRWTWEPAKLLALGNVLVGTPRLEGSTAELQAHWPQPHSIPGTTAPNADARGAAGQRARVLVRYRPAKIQLRENQSQDSAGAPNSKWHSGEQASSLPATPAARAVKKVFFSGAAVRMSMAGGDDPTSFRELTVEGGVQVRGEETEPGAQPMVIHGHLLRIVPVGEQLFRFTVTGGPQEWATASARGMTLMGGTLNLDQAANRMWINGPGRMIAERAPNAEPGRAPEGALPGSRVWPSRTEVQWRGGMVFDGQQIYFEQQILSDSKQAGKDVTDRVQTQSQALYLTLNQFIDFKNTEGAPADVDIQKLVLAGRLAEETRVFDLAELDADWPAPAGSVVIANTRTDQAGKTSAVQQLVVPDATIDTQSGDVQSVGAGTVISRQRGGSLQRPVGPQTVSAPVRAPSNQLNFIQVDYRRGLSGNIHRQELQFTGQVQCVYGPIEGWGDRLEYSPGNQLADRVFNLACEQLDLAQWTPRGQADPIAEIVATGSAHARGEQFEAVAHRIRYQQESDVVVVEAGARGDAQLWHRRPGDSKRDHLVAEKIQYNLTRGTYQVEGHKRTQIIRDGKFFDDR